MRWWHGVACCGAECPALFRGSTLRCRLPVCKLTGVADHPSSPVLWTPLPSMCCTDSLLPFFLFTPSSPFPLCGLSTVNWFCSLFELGPVWLLVKGWEGSSGCLINHFCVLHSSVNLSMSCNCFRWMLINIFVVKKKKKLPVCMLSCFSALLLKDDKHLLVAATQIWGFEDFCCHTWQ